MHPVVLWDNIWPHASSVGRRRLVSVLLCGHLTVEWSLLKKHEPFTWFDVNFGYFALAKVVIFINNKKRQITSISVIVMKKRKHCPTQFQFHVDEGFRTKIFQD